MGKFDGKKLLVLGTSIGSVEIVDYAKLEGAYVIVADYLPKEKSEAKKHADEDVMISTTDIAALCEFGEERAIDGVFCGVSEVNLLSVNAVAKKLGLPCYFSREQWNLSGNKANFKQLCKKYGIPVAKDYLFDGIPSKQEALAIQYPVIVKPIDRSAGIGIHVCYNADDFLTGYRDAYEKSFSNQVIVEKYIVGIEFNVAYTVIDGEIRLSSMGDKYLNREQIGLMPMAQTHIFPSQYLEKYVNEVNDSVIDMFKEIGIKNGTFFVQGLTDGKEMVLIEAGLRMEGTAMFKFVSQTNGINIMELMTEYALTGTMTADINLEDPFMNGKVCCLFSLLNGGGIVKTVEGLDKFINRAEVIEIMERYKVGATIIKDGTLKQVHIRFYLIGDSREEMKGLIDEIQNKVSIRDCNDENMLLSPFDTKRIINKGTF